VTVDLVLTEGGHQFEGSSRIPKDCIHPTLIALLSNVLANYGISEQDLTLLGSAGKKPDSGDLDLLVPPEILFPDLTEEDFDEDISDRIKEFAESLKHEKGVYKTRASTALGFVSMQVPIYNSEGRKTKKRVQVDLFIAPKEVGFDFFYGHIPPNEDWEKASSQRNLLLRCFLGSIMLRSEDKNRERLSYRPARGVYKKKEEFGITRTGNPVWRPRGKELVNRNPLSVLSTVLRRDINLSSVAGPDEVLGLIAEYVKSLSESEVPTFVEVFIDHLERECISAGRPSGPSPLDCDKTKERFAAIMGTDYADLLTEGGVPVSGSLVSSRLLDAVAGACVLDEVCDDFGNRAVISLGYSQSQGLCEVWYDGEGERVSSQSLTESLDETMTILSLPDDGEALESPQKLLSAIVACLQERTIPYSAFSQSLRRVCLNERDMDVLSYLEDSAAVLSAIFETDYSDDTLAEISKPKDSFSPERTRELAKYIQKVIGSKVSGVSAKLDDPRALEGDIVGRISDSTQKYFSIEHASDMLETKSGKEALDVLLNEEVWVSEKVDGQQFGIIKDEGGVVRYRTKNFFLTKPMMLSGSWDILVSRLEAIRENTNNFDFLPNDSQVIGEMLISTTQNQILYKRIPKGNFVVFDVRFSGAYQDLDTINEVATLLESEPISLIFRGRLSDEQKASILSFLSTPVEERREKLFGTGSFTEYILGMLNPAVKPMLGENVEGIVLKHYSQSPDGEVIFTKLVDPEFTETLKSRRDVDRGSNIGSYFKWVIQSYVTETRISKAADYVFTEFIPASGREYSTDEIYSLIVETLFNDVVKEHKPALYQKFKEGGYIQTPAKQAGNVLNTKQLLDPEVTLPNLESDDVEFSEVLKNVFKYFMGKLSKTWGRPEKSISDEKGEA
jgi:hypothetical protein